MKSKERTEKRTETHTCDCISRKDAIRWIKTECNPYGKPTLDFESGKRVMKHLEQMPPAQPKPSEITDEQAILHLQSTGWMQNHDREMYESGLREQLADDSGGYDSLIPCEDTISRQAAINAIDCINGAEEVLRSLPPAQPEQRWIPCSEQLPRQGQEVICQCRANMIKVLKLDAYGDWYQDANHCYMGGFVIAWMPLPEPYKEGETI